MSQITPFAVWLAELKRIIENCRNVACSPYSARKSRTQRARFFMQKHGVPPELASLKEKKRVLRVRNYIQAIEKGRPIAA